MPLSALGVSGSMERPQRRQRGTRFQVACLRARLHPDGDGIPTASCCSWCRVLSGHDTVQERGRRVGVRPLEEQAAVMAQQPSVQRLHPNEVRDDDVFFGLGQSSQFRSPAPSIQTERPAVQGGYVPLPAVELVAGVLRLLHQARSRR